MRKGAGEFRDCVVILSRELEVADATGEEVESWPTPLPLGTAVHWAKIDTAGGGETTDATRGSFDTLTIRFRHLVDLASVDKIRLKATGQVFSVGPVWRERAEGNRFRTVCQVVGDGEIDAEAPTVLSATIAADGLTLTVVFSEEVYEAVSDTYDFVITADGDNMSALPQSGQGSDTWIFSLSSDVLSTETATLAYSSSSSVVRDWAGNALVAFSGAAVTNNSEVEFSPDDLAGLSAWYDASQEIVADGTAISSSTDRSGNGRHAVQATGANQPIFKAAIQNGRGVYRFDGTNDFLRVAFTRNQPHTAFAVAKVSAVNGGNHQAIIDGNSDDSASLMITAGGTILNAFAGALLATGDAMGLVNFHRIAAVFNGASSSIQYDAVAADTGNAGASNAGGVSIGGNGGNRAFNGDVGEVVLYSRALSAGEISQVMAYLSTKWGV